MDYILVMTTIFVPESLRAWRAALGPEVPFLVAGDRKSPHREIENLLAEVGGPARYLPPEAQTAFESSEVLGWNCIQRRNIALLEALRDLEDPENTVILLVDDDNWPVQPPGGNPGGFRESLDSLFGRDFGAVRESSTGWYNAGDLLRPSVVHRGFPVARRHETPALTYSHETLRVGVAASLWLGDPDIDAVERMVKAPDVRYLRQSAFLARGTWCPFNSQATAVRANLVPLMMCWPGVGRMDDIWASLLTRRAMDHLGWYVHYGEPLVRQDRNPHDLVKDLKAELLGYQYTEELAQVLRDTDLGMVTTPWGALTELYAAVDDLCPWLPDQTRRALWAWHRDLTAVLKEGC